MSISVVIPCYRCRDTLERAVASALRQTRVPEEVILVDDASPDGETLRRAAQSSAGRVRIVSLPHNRGAASARNAGWDAARGELVAFLDADDAWHPRKLELQAGLMERHPEYSLSGHLHLLDGDAEMVEAEPRHVEIGFTALLFRNRFATSSVMLKRSLRERFADDQRYGEDYLLWLRLAAAGHRMARLEARLVTRFQPPFGGAGLSGQLWPMERAELRSYRAIHAEGAIGWGMLGMVTGWSLARYGRRAVVTGLRRLRQPRERTQRAA